MFKKVLTLSAAMLLLVSYTVNAMTMQCGDMTPADCKKHFGMEMEKMAKMKVIESMKAHMMKMIDFYTAVKNDMPADGMHAKTMMKAIDDMKASMLMMDKMDGMSMDEMQHTMERAFISMQPDFTEAQTKDSNNMEKFNESMDKHGHTPDMAADVLIAMMTGFEQMWKDMYAGLRPQDMKEYPKYAEMNDMMKTMMETTDKNMKLEMFAKTMMTMMQFNETPFMTAMMRTMTVTKE